MTPTCVASSTASRKGRPVDFHLATVDVLEDGDGALVIYGSDVEPDEVADAMGPSSSPASTASKQ